ncbi:hypothetical protein ACYRFS_02255 [Listeria kieliensis]
MIVDLKHWLDNLFPDMKFLGFVKATNLDSMIVIEEVPIFQDNQITKQSRVRENIGLLIYDKNTERCKKNYDTLRDFFLTTYPSRLEIPNQKVINTTISSGGKVDFDDDERLVYQLTILFEKEM